MTAERHVWVSVTVDLANGRTWGWAWTAPTTLGRSPSRALRWARETMREEKVEGRSKIVGFTITAKERSGHYQEAP